MNIANFEQMMEELRKEYLESLPSRIQEIQTKSEQNKVQEVLEHFHKLKGTGKTYGIPEISELGEVMERICRELPAQANQHVPDAVTLLRTIHQERSARRPVDLSNDPRFSKLKSLI